VFVLNLETNMTAIATCHCGGTRIKLPEAPTHATSCTCTFCTKTGGLWAYYRPEVPKIVADEHRVEYTQSGFNMHYFCGKCGCTTYGISPDWTLGGDGIPEKKKFAINVRLLDDVDIKALAINEIDGRNLW
jgi:hypothetical protein